MTNSDINNGASLQGGRSRKRFRVATRDIVFGKRIAGAVSLGEGIIDLHRSFLQENQDRGELLLRHDRPLGISSPEGLYYVTENR